MLNSKAPLFCLLSFVGGIFIASFSDVPKLIIYELFVLGLFYCLAFFRQKTIVIFAVCLIIFGLGIWRVEIEKPVQLPGVRPLAPAGAEPMAFIKERLLNIINQNLSPPHSGILAGILLGEQKEISKEWKEKLNKTGVRHIAAVSGMHVVIFSGILFWLGIFLGLYRGQAFYFAGVFLWFFIALIGFPASAVRAGIMGTMFLFCEKVGRQKAAGRALILTASIMLAINPLLLKNDIGFQLSFLATLGIIYLYPFFQGFFKSPKSDFNNFGLMQKGIGLLAMTLSAQVFTLPVLIYHFGQVSLVSPAVNILIVPIVSYLMVAGFLFLLAGVLWPPLGLVFLFPTWLLLDYLIKIVDWFSSFSFSATYLNFHWFWFFVFYAFLAFLLWRFSEKQKQELQP